MGNGGDRTSDFFPMKLPRYQMSWRLLIMPIASCWEENILGGAVPHNTSAAEQAKNSMNKLRGHKKSGASF